MSLLWMISQALAGDFSQKLQDMIVSTECPVSKNISYVISVQEKEATLELSSVELPSCLRDIITIFPYPDDMNVQYFVVDIKEADDSPEIRMMALPKIGLHYFYENPTLSIEQRVELALFLGVLNE